MKKSNSLYYIAIIQIVACLGVMNGHFLMYFASSLLSYLRTSAYKYSVLAYFYMGDLNVQLFFVLGGFLIPLSTAGKEFSYRQVVKKWSSLIIPAIILTTVLFLFTCILQSTPIGELLPEHADSTLEQYVDDILIFLTGKVHLTNKENYYTPYALSPLWFLFPFVQRWIVSYALYHLCKNKGKKVLVTCSALVCLLYSDCINVVTGMLFGELSKEQKIQIKPTLGLIIATATLCVCPVMFSVNSLYITQMCFYVFLGISFWMLASSNPPISENGKTWRTISAFRGNTLGIYFTHFPVILLLLTICTGLSKRISVWLLYIALILITYICAMLSKMFLFKPVTRITNNILEQS